MSTPTLQPLPDVAGDTARAARALDWVGMQRIALPLSLAEQEGGTVRVPASADIAVNLLQPEARGIHMSRLYLKLQDELGHQVLSPALLAQVLRDCIDSQSGLADRARLTLRYAHLLRRPALASSYSGWKDYPVTIEALMDPQGLQLTLSFAVEYSSTCPASAALSRQLNARRFNEDFGVDGEVSAERVGEWLASERGLAATPHAQRSRADIRVQLSGTADGLPLESLVDAIEQALATPVQTAVKREDEQAFARLNAENLMFCEDAARRVAAVLSADARVTRFDATVSHFESLHAHDAVASVSGTGRAIA